MKYIAYIPRAAVCVLLAAALCCGCAPASTAPASSSGSAAASEASQTESLPSPTPSAASGAAQEDAANQNTASAALSGTGLMIMYSDSQSLGSTVMCGGKVLCRGAPSDTLTLVYSNGGTASGYYLHAWNDSSAPTGRRCAIYDKTGAEVLAFDEEVRAWLTGSYLTIHTDTSLTGEYDISAPGTLRLFKLGENGAEELTVPQNAVDCVAAGDYLAYTIYNMPSGITDIYDDDTRLAHCSVQVQAADGSVVYEQSGCTASDLYGTSAQKLGGWLSLTYYTPSESGYGCESDTAALYCPASDLTLTDYIQLCGNGTASFKTESGEYQLIDLSGEQPVVLGTFSGTPTDYIPGKARLWLGESAVLQDLATGEQQALRSCGGTDELFSVYTAGGEVLLYSAATGEELMRAEVNFSSSDENGYSISALGGGYVWLQKYGGADTGSEIIICGPDGTVKDITALTQKYLYISDLTVTASGPVFSASYTGAGGSTLTDVLDCEGNVLLHGLSYAYAGSGLPQGYFLARRGYYYGLMSTSGEWAYCDSIFSTLSADDGIGYIWG